MRPLCGYRCTRDLPPGLKSLHHLLAIHSGREAVTPRAEVRRKGTVRGKKTLRLPRGFEAWHPPLPLTRRLGRIFGSIIEILVLTMLHPGQYLPHGSAIARQPVSDDGPVADLAQFLRENVGSLISPVTTLLKHRTVRRR